MKVSKRQLRKIIKEEKAQLINEMWGDSVDTMSDLISFAQAYSGLGSAVQDQVDAIVAAYNEWGGERDQFVDVLYEQNPNAIDLAYGRLGSVLGMMDGDDALAISEALEAAQEIYAMGEAEVEADRMAAEGMTEGEYQREDC